MSDERASEDPRRPLPQVGAVLYLDTELGAGDRFSGHKHWKLVGSCTLVGRQHVLTVAHVLGGRWTPHETMRRYHAVFLPYEGLFAIDGEPEWEPQVEGDNLVLVKLAGQIDHCAPFRPWTTQSLVRYDGRASVHGYGSWPRSDRGRLQGVQQGYEVELGPPLGENDEQPAAWQRYHILDVSFSAAENDVIIGRANSGGPFLWRLNGSSVVTGISRETQGDQQAGSWIGWTRRRWLKAQLLSFPTEPLSAPLATSWQLLRINGEADPAEGGAEVRLPVPAGATGVKATLNASDGLRLQMKVVPGEKANNLRDLSHDDKNSGQFLFRTTKLPPNTEEIVIGVCRVASAPVRAEEVVAQLCVLFTGGADSPQPVKV